jgi:hypothetical protein
LQPIRLLMPFTEPIVLLAFAAIGLALVTAVLHTLAFALFEEERLTTLRTEVMDLRKSYALRKAEQAGPLVVDEAPAEV